MGCSCAGLSGRAPHLLGILDGFGLDKELLIGITSINQTLGLPCLYMYSSTGALPLHNQSIIFRAIFAFNMLDFFSSWTVQKNDTDVAAVGQFSYRKWLLLDSNLNMKKMHNQATYQ